LTELGYRPRFPQERNGCRGRACQDDVGLETNQFLRELSYLIDVTATPPKVYPYVAASIQPKPASA
jgi:hypothetical protein